MRTIEDQDHENTGACTVDSVLTLTGTFSESWLKLKWAGFNDRKAEWYK